MRESDYDTVLALWQAGEGVEVAEGDSRQEIAAFLQRNPELSRVAERDSVLVGAVLCGHDGHRGYLYHLVVADACRGQGLGRRLVDECRAGLRACGIVRAVLLVAKTNEGGAKFWKSVGFDPIDIAEPYGIDLE